MIDLGARPVELDDQQRLALQRIAGMDEILRGVDRRAVHHLHAARNDAGADDVGDALAGLLAGGEADQQRARRFRLLQDAHGDFGDDAEQPLRAGHDAEQVIALAVEMRAAEPHDRAVHQHHLDAEHIVGGQPVFQAMHAAGILGDIAADRAGDLRGRIGRVVEAVLLDRVGDAEIGDARLRNDDAVWIVDRQDAVEAAHDQQHGILERQRAAGQRSAGAARHDADVALVAIFQDARDLRHGLRQHHHQRQLAIGGEPVALEGAHAVDLVDDALARHDDAHVGNDLGAARQRRGVGLRHGNAGHLLLPRAKVRLKVVKRFYQ